MSLRDALTILQRLSAWIRPRLVGVAETVIGDLPRSKADLITENLLLRQQLITLLRSVTKSRISRADRLILLTWARLNNLWRSALLIVQPETLLRWHRDLFRWVWWRKSKPKTIPRVPQGAITLLRQMASDNLTWGAERIRGELLKLNIYLSKRTILRYIRQERSKFPPGQNWKTFLDNHKDVIWACDFLQVYDILFRPLFLFFLIELGSRRLAHVGVTRSPTDAWIAQQIREATPWNAGPRFLIRDNDGKFGKTFQATLAARGIEDVRLPCYSPNLNAAVERFQGSVRRECLDHIIVLNEQHLQRMIREYVAYYNQMRPHQGIGQSIPDPPSELYETGAVDVQPVLGGLHHHYYRKVA